VTRFNQPAPGRGWQASPGQPMPRAAGQPAIHGPLLVMVLLVWFTPLSLLAWLLGAGGDLGTASLALVALHPRQPGLDRHRAAGRRSRGRPAPPPVCAPALLGVRGPPLRLRPPRHPHHHRPVPLGPAGHRGVAGRPGGLLAASLSVWRAEWAAGGAEWSPFVRRRQRIDQRAHDRKTARLLAKPRDHQLTAPALGIALDGDLGNWRQGRYVVPPAQLRGKAMAVVGAPEPARPSPCCAWPIWPGCWVARSASSTARALTPPWSLR
jgi:hypothetical protein